MKLDTLTYDQRESLYTYTEKLIENLDETSLIQLFGGYDNDINKMFLKIQEEIYNVLFNQKNDKIISSSLGYLDKLSESINEYLLCEDLNYFIANVLHDFDIDWFHLEWGILANTYPRLCILAPRGHGKSWFWSKAYPLWKLYRYKKKTLMNQYLKYSISKKGIILTNEFKLGKSLLNEIKTEIETNDILREKLFTGKKEGWKESHLKLKNGTQLMIGSLNSRKRGYHVGWAVVDDYLTDAVLTSSDQNTKIKNDLKGVVENIILPNGQCIVVGTPFSDNDYYMDLKKSKKFKVFEYPAIMPNYSLLSPNRWNLENILEKKELLGSTIFSREILVRPISSESSIFPYSILDKALIGMENYILVENRHSFVNKQTNIPKQFSKIVVGCDFAKSANIGADYTVYTVFGIEGERESSIFWLMYMWRKQGATYNEQIQQLKRINQNFEPDVIVLETNNFQQIYYEQCMQAGLPVVSDVTTNEKKSIATGVPHLAVIFEQNRFKFPRGNEYSIQMTDLICQEMNSVSWVDNGIQGVGSHDDICMSIWKAIKGNNTSSFNFTFI